MIKNQWSMTKLFCGNHGSDHSNEMQLKQGPHSLFYSCPCYKSIYGKDHEGRSCNNRLTLVDFEDMLHTITEKAYEHAPEETDLTGYKWQKKGVTYEILEQKDGAFSVLMLNKKAISK